MRRCSVRVGPVTRDLRGLPLLFRDFRRCRSFRGHRRWWRERRTAPVRYGHAFVVDELILVKCPRQAGKQTAEKRIRIKHHKRIPIATPRLLDCHLDAASPFSMGVELYNDTTGPTACFVVLRNGGFR